MTDPATPEELDQFYNAASQGDIRTMFNIANTIPLMFDDWRIALRRGIDSGNEMVINFLVNDYPFEQGLRQFLQHGFDYAVHTNNPSMEMYIGQVADEIGYSINPMFGILQAARREGQTVPRYLGPETMEELSEKWRVPK